MTSFLPIAPLLMAFAFACVSCGDNPELVEKREKQKAEITRLRGELALVEAKMKNLPPDVSEELEQVKLRAATQREEVAGLQAEITKLEERKSALEAEYSAYQAKYRVN